MRNSIFSLLWLFLAASLFPQIVFRSLPDNKPVVGNLDFFESSSIRKKIVLNGKWDVYLDSDKKRAKASVEVPSIYEGDEDVVFEKTFSLSKDQVEKNTHVLHLLGLNYGADISLNYSVVYRHQGGAFPFQVSLPPDLFKYDQPNILSIKIHPAEGERNRIPLSYQLFYPKEYAGIFRDVYISEVPAASIDRYSAETISASEGKARIQISCTLQRRNTKVETFASEGDGFSIEASLISADGQTSGGANEVHMEVKKGKEKSASFFLDISSPRLWSPENPQGYRLKLRLLKGTDVIDEVSQPFAVIHLSLDQNGFALNGSPFKCEGTAYVPQNKNYWSMNNYEAMRQDIKMIKELGFNAVRFTMCMPHPYLLSACEELGLIAFIELPMQSTPVTLLGDNVYLNESKNFVAKWENAYSNFPALAAFGLGSGNRTSDEANSFFLSQTAEALKQQSSRLVYANTIVNAQPNEIAGIDFYGLEFIGTDLSVISEQYAAVAKKLGPSRVFIAGLMYLVTEGSSSGYTNANSYEAQAKYFSDFYKYATHEGLPGYFMGYMFDYRSGLPVLMGKYNDLNLFPVGLVGEDRNPNRPAYKVLYALLHNLQPVTVPIGIKKDNSPLVFIIFGMILAILTGFLINSSRKFREDASRALVRPYNFFADVRDARMYTWTPSFILSLLVSGSMSLVISSFLYYFRTSVTFEKFVSVVPYEWAISFISYISWHPIHSILLLTILVWLQMVLFAGLIRLAAYTVMNRIYFSSAFYVVSWAHIPVLLLIPFAIILYRILLLSAANVYIYIAWAAFTLWIALRVFKGAYVIFDIAPRKVYFIGALAFLALVAGVGYYYQSSYLSVDYLLQAIHELKPGA